MLLIPPHLYQIPVSVFLTKVATEHCYCLEKQQQQKFHVDEIYFVYFSISNLGNQIETSDCTECCIFVGFQSICG